MSFSDMDRMEARYGGRTEEEQEKIDNAKDWEFLYAEPKDDDELEKVQIARRIEQEKLTKFLILFGVIAILIVALWIWEGERLIDVLLLLLAIPVIFIVYGIVRKIRAKKSIAKIAKVKAIDKDVIRNRKTVNYFLSLAEFKTGMFITKMRVDRYMYDGYYNDRTVYLVKFGKTVRAIYD